MNIYADFSQFTSHRSETILLQQGHFYKENGTINDQVLNLGITVFSQKPRSCGKKAITDDFNIPQSMPCRQDFVVSHYVSVQETCH